MSDCDQELFEAESRKLAPARPPAELMARLSPPITLHLQPSTLNHAGVCCCVGWCLPVLLPQWWLWWFGGHPGRKTGRAIAEADVNKL